MFGTIGYYDEKLERMVTLAGISELQIKWKRKTEEAPEVYEAAFKAMEKLDVTKSPTYIIHAELHDVWVDLVVKDIVGAERNEWKAMVVGEVTTY